MEPTDTIRVLNDEGREIECDVLFTFERPDTKKSYIVYTDNTKDEDGSIQVYASVYDPKGEDPALYPVETEAEWRLIDTILDKVQKEAEARVRKKQSDG